MMKAVFVSAGSSSHKNVPSNWSKWTCLNVRWNCIRLSCELMLTEFEEHIVKRSIRSGGPGSRQLFKTEEVRRLSIAAFMHNPNWCGGGDLHQMAMHGCSCVLKITVYFLNNFLNNNTINFRRVGIFMCMFSTNGVIGWKKWMVVFPGKI